MTIGQRENQRQGSDQTTIDDLRQTSTKAIGRYLHTLSQDMERDKGLGNSIVREFHVQDETHYVIEQGISLCVNRSSGTNAWTSKQLEPRTKFSNLIFLSPSLARHW